MRDTNNALHDLSALWSKINFRDLEELARVDEMVREFEEIIAHHYWAIASDEDNTRDDDSPASRCLAKFIEKKRDAEAYAALLQRYADRKVNH
jgi:uncharacterized protein (DUF305 family)